MNQTTTTPEQVRRQYELMSRDRNIHQLNAQIVTIISTSSAKRLIVTNEGMEEISDHTTNMQLLRIQSILDQYIKNKYPLLQYYYGPNSRS